MRRIVRTILIVIAIVILAFIAWFAYLYFSPLPAEPATSSSGTTTATTTQTTTLTPDEAAVSKAVTAFGAQEQLVSLLAPDASTTMASHYGPYVVPPLLLQWQADPQSAPGRVVSSPWPDHIMINSIIKTPSGYEVKATLVLMSSNSVEHGGNDGTDPVIIDLVQENGAWLISSYQDQNAG